MYPRCPATHWFVASAFNPSLRSLAFFCSATFTRVLSRVSSAYVLHLVHRVSRILMRPSCCTRRRCPKTPSASLSSGDSNEVLSLLTQPTFSSDIPGGLPHLRYAPSSGFFEPLDGFFSKTLGNHFSCCLRLQGLPFEEYSFDLQHQVSLAYPSTPLATANLNTPIAVASISRF